MTAVETIQNNPDLKQKLISAVAKDSIATTKSILNHPVASFIIIAIEDLKDN